MNQVKHRPQLAKRAMHAALWTTQLLWGAVFSITGVGKRARGSRCAGPRRFCSGLVQVDTHSLIALHNKSTAPC
jgi:hypothetical protein